MNLPASLQFHVLPDLPMVEAGDDLAALLEVALRRLPVTLDDGDVLEAGANVRVVGVEGARLRVRRA